MDLMNLQEGRREKFKKNVKSYQLNMLMTMPGSFNLVDLGNDANCF